MYEGDFVNIDINGINLPPFSRTKLNKMLVLKINKELTNLGIGIHAGYKKSFGIRLTDDGYEMMYFGDNEKDLPTHSWIVGFNVVAFFSFKDVKFKLSKELKEKFR